MTKPVILPSAGWSSIHLEVFQQPKFEIIEHQHTMQSLLRDCLMIQSVNAGSMESVAKKPGIFDIAVIPAGIAHRCDWNTSAQFLVLAIVP